MTKSQSKKERDAKALWVHHHRGKLAQIAKSLQVSHAAVHAVLYYNMPSKDCRIERALAQAGAPFMTERLADRIAAERERVA